MALQDPAFKTHKLHIAPKTCFGEITIVRAYRMKFDAEVVGKAGV